MIACVQPLFAKALRNSPAAPWIVPAATCAEVMRPHRLTCMLVLIFRFVYEALLHVSVDFA